MIKLRNFWVMLAMGCAFTLGTASCNDDDEKEDDPTETSDPEVISTEDAGDLMKDVVKKYNDMGQNILAQATSMTKDQLYNLAGTVIEYNKNKDNSVWMEKFLGSVSSNEGEKADAKNLLNEAIEKLVKVGVVMEEISVDDLLGFISSYNPGSDSHGQGEADGMKEGATHKELFDSIYEEKIAPIPATEEGIDEMVNVFKTLPKDQQNELIGIVLAWSNMSNDEAWKEGFLKGVEIQDDKAKTDLKEKLDYLASNIGKLAAAA